MEVQLESLYKAVLKGDRKSTEEIVHDALSKGITAESILYEALIPAMNEVGSLYEKGEYYVPEMLMSAKAMQEGGMRILRPLLVDSDVQPQGRVVIGTVKGDLHDIGKNLVGIMLEGAGLEIIDLGADVDPQKFVSAVMEYKPDILALSALLTTTMPSMAATIEALNTAGARNQVKVIIGGAPVTNDYATKIGADGFAPDASRATKLAKSLIKV